MNSAHLQDLPEVRKLDIFSYPILEIDLSVRCHTQFCFIYIPLQFQFLNVSINPWPVHVAQLFLSRSTPYSAKGLWRRTIKFRLTERAY